MRHTFYIVVSSIATTAGWKELCESVEKKTAAVAGRIFVSFSTLSHSLSCLYDDYVETTMIRETGEEKKLYNKKHDFPRGVLLPLCRREGNFPHNVSWKYADKIIANTHKSEFKFVIWFAMRRLNYFECYLNSSSRYIMLILQILSFNSNGVWKYFDDFSNHFTLNYSHLQPSQRSHDGLRSHLLSCG